MENDPDQQPQQNQPPVVEPVIAGQVVPPANPVTVSPPPNNPAPTQAPDSMQQPVPAPQRKPHHYIVAGFGVLIVLAIFLPRSNVAQMLCIPIVILGAAGGITFFVESIHSSKKSNPFVRSFLILGGLGVGIVIFNISLIAGLVVFTSKNPNPPPPS